MALDENFLEQTADIQIGRHPIIAHPLERYAKIFEPLEGLKSMWLAFGIYRIGL